MPPTRPALLLLLVPIVLSCGGTPMLYPAPGVPVPSPPPSPLEEVRLEVEDVGGLSAWYHPGESPGPSLVFFHGNGENLETLRLSGTLAAFAELGLPYLAVDYPGYGRSEGKPREYGLVDGGVASVEWMEAREPGRRVVVVGWSLGAAVAIQVATLVEVEALVAMSPWTSLEAIGRQHFPGWLVSAFVRERYDSIALAPGISVPALVVHGERDEIIPVAHGRSVAAKLPRAELVEVAGYGHNDLLGAPVVWDELRRFLGGFV